MTGLWNLWGVDIIATCGNRYIVVATDYFSKWPEACALPNKNATSVEIFCTPCTAAMGLVILLLTKDGNSLTRYKFKQIHIFMAGYFSMTCRLLMFYAKHSKWTTGLHQHIIHNPMGYVKG